MIINIYKGLTLLTAHQGVHVSNRPTRDFLALDLAPELNLWLRLPSALCGAICGKTPAPFPLLPPFAPVQRVVDDKNDFFEHWKPVIKSHEKSSKVMKSHLRSENLAQRAQPPVRRDTGAVAPCSRDNFVIKSFCHHFPQVIKPCHLNQAFTRRQKPKNSVIPGFSWVGNKGKGNL